MYNVAVLEPFSGKVTSQIRDRLIEGATGASVVLSREERLDCFSGTYDLFVVTAGEEGERGANPPSLRAKILLVPGSISPETALGIPSNWVLSYGLSGKDSITISSLKPKAAVLAIQRELVTLEETLIDRQELPVHFPEDLNSQEIMALYGSLLVLGVKPEALAKRSKQAPPRP